MKNQVVTINTNYCYLGSHVADATFDLKRRISKAWAAAKSFQDIWQSSVVTNERKRGLFYALVERGEAPGLNGLEREE